jgi:general secretion pathway protein D
VDHEERISCRCRWRDVAGSDRWSGRGAGTRPKPSAGRAICENLKENLKEVLELRFDLRFQDTPLKDVVSDLTELTGVTFYLAQKKLEEASVSPDTPVNSAFKNIRLRTWLDIALKEFELTYLLKDDIILITTPEDAESKLVICVYDCRDILATASRSKNGTKTSDQPASESQTGESTHAARLLTPEELRNSRGRNQMGGSLGGDIGQNIPHRDAFLRSLTEEGRKAELLLDVVIISVAPDTWDQVGGPGSITEFGGLIVVSQTQLVQDEVERLFDMLREAAGLEVSKGGKVVR